MAEHTENVLDGLYSTLSYLYSIDNDLIPESERLKIAGAVVVLLVVTNMLCGDSVEDIDARVREMREK